MSLMVSTKASVSSPHTKIWKFSGLGPTLDTHICYDCFCKLETCDLSRSAGPWRRLCDLQTSKCMSIQASGTMWAVGHWLF